MKTTKEQLRKIYKTKRLEEEFNPNILVRILDQKNWKWEKSNVEIFLPKEGEINTFPLVTFLRNNNAQIISTVMKEHNKTLESKIWESTEQLVDNKWGIPEPINGQKIDKSEIDIVFVPLLVADKKGMRVGYGKGYYDRHLPECTNAKFIGLSQFDLITEITDINEFDIPMHYCLCPNGLYAF